MKLAAKDLRKIVQEEVAKAAPKKRGLREDYARGIPDFALSQVAAEAAEGMKRHLKRYVLQTASDPVKQRQMLAAANEVLEELEDSMKELMEDKLLKFIRMV